MIDNVDRKILSLLQENARMSNAQIAREVSLAPSGILERIRKLEAKGIIKGYHASLDRAKLGYNVTAYSFIRTDDKMGECTTAERLAEMPDVDEVHHIAGEDCYLVKLRCSSNEDLGRILRERIGVISEVRSSRTSIVLETIKASSMLPLEQETE